MFVNRSTALAAAFAAGGVLISGGLVQAQPGEMLDKDSLVEATILADTTAVRAGTTFTVGILYKMQPDWHIYYKNPGESGFATSVNWKLPEGASVGETMYPAPLTFESPGAPDPLVSYGYDGETMLLAEVNLAAVPDEGPVEINASSRWLMCSDRCIPNRKDLTLTLPAGDPQPANKEIFDKYRQQIPQAVGELPATARVNTTVDGSTTRYELTITPPEGKQVVAGTPATNANGHAPYFYPAVTDGYIVTPAKMAGNAIDAGGTRVYEGPVTMTWEAKPESNAAEPLNRLEGTLVYQFVGEGNLESPVLLEVRQNL